MTLPENIRIPGRLPPPSRSGNGKGRPSPPQHCLRLSNAQPTFSSYSRLPSRCRIVTVAVVGSVRSFFVIRWLSPSDKSFRGPSELFRVSQSSRQPLRSHLPHSLWITRPHRRPLSLCNDRNEFTVTNMARITNWLSTLHAFLTALPQNGYHNISRVVQPQMRSICESFQANPLRSKSGIELQSMKTRVRPTSLKGSQRPLAIR